MAVNKPVYFNEENEQDRMMLKFLENKKFATYVKNLIMSDMKSNSSQDKNEILDVLQEIAGILRNGVTVSGQACTESTGSTDKKKLDKISKFESMAL